MRASVGNMLSTEELRGRDSNQQCHNERSIEGTGAGTLSSRHAPIGCSWLFAVVTSRPAAPAALNGARGCLSPSKRAVHVPGQEAQGQDRTPFSDTDIGLSVEHEAAVGHRTPDGCSGRVGCAFPAGSR
uniref:Uncharacterized protein n=1 Tax=Knipowitschia caucasica TaxID=637954 RepID=A0AAV2KUJ6_KNICA